MVVIEDDVFVPLVAVVGAVTVVIVVVVVVVVLSLQLSTLQ